MCLNIFMVEVFFLQAGAGLAQVQGGEALVVVIFHFHVHHYHTWDWG